LKEQLPAKELTQKSARLLEFQQELKVGCFDTPGKRDNRLRRIEGRQFVKSLPPAGTS